MNEKKRMFIEANEEKTRPNSIKKNKNGNALKTN